MSRAFLPMRLTTRQVCDLAGFGEETLRRRVAAGRMPARTEVAVYSPAELARMRPASARLVNQFEAALDKARTQVGA
jgi:hypothetical protein